MPESGGRDFFFLTNFKNLFKILNHCNIWKHLYGEERGWASERGEVEDRDWVWGSPLHNDHATPQKGTNRADPLSGMLEKGLFLWSA